MNTLENPKHAPEKLKWQEKLLKQLQEEFPEANFRQNEEYFIYNVAGAEIHTPKWIKIPVQESPDEQPHIVPVEDVIRSNILNRSNK